MTVHQNPISVNGWSGSGYSIIDAGTGVGAYKISGGSSGGFSDVIVATIITIFGFLAAPILYPIFLPAAVGGAAIASASLALVNFFLWTFSMRNSGSYESFNTNNLAAGFAFAGGAALLKLSVGLSFLPLIIFYEGILIALSVL